MTLKQRINAFANTGAFIRRHFSGEHSAAETALHTGLEKVIELAHVHNNWFIPNFVKHAISNIGQYLNGEELTTFSKNIKETDQKTVAVICAGNVPMVGWHDIMCILLSGHKALIKLSADDNVLLPFFLKMLVHYEPALENDILFAQGKLSSFDAVIATGSNNTASHFRYYFGKYPHIIRQNRSSLAVLTGEEETDELEKLGTDVFMYFGLGCRNVSKLLVPEEYDFGRFFEAMLPHADVIQNKKYGNNYEYHRAIYLLEKLPFLDNNFLLIKEDAGLHAPVGVLYFSRYKSTAELNTCLEASENELQCVVGRDFLPFGYSQRPVITEYADKVNTLAFLVNL